MEKKLTCAFVTYYPMPDLRAYSGTSYFMAHHLEKAGVEVTFVFAPLPPPSLTFRLRRKIYQKVLHRGMREDRDPGILRAVSRTLEQKLKTLNYDFILSPGSLPVAYLQSDKPCFFWSDSTFGAYINYVEGFMDMSPETIWRGRQTETKALENSATAFYSSSWAAESAIKDHGANRNQVKVIPYGANLAQVPERAVIEQAIEERVDDELRLLFIGLEWERKGGPKVLQVLAELVNQGQKVILEIVGCEPEIPASLRASVRIHGYISKKTPEGLEKLEGLLRQSHFFIMLSKAEAFGIVFCESSAYGLPSLANREGGMTSAVRDGVNGQLFDVQATPLSIADYIRATWSDRAAYRRLARSARLEFEQRLSWPVAISTFLDEVKKHLPDQQPLEN